MGGVNIFTSSGLAEVTAAVLAGGLGIRLRPVVADRPKVLADVRGRPFLAYILDQLAAVGIRDVVLCTGWLGEQVEEALGSRYGSLHLTYSQESSLLGTAGALQLALPLLKSDRVLVMNGDSFCQVDLQDLWQWHQYRDAQATLVLTETEDTGRYGRVWVDEEGLVLGFDEKGSERGPGLINAGVYLLNREMLLTPTAQRAGSLERDVFPSWVGQGLYGYKSQAPFLDIGTPEAYAKADGFFKEISWG